VSGTSDIGVLDEEIPFLAGRKVRPEEDSYYDLPCQSATSGTLYEHCVRAIRWGLKFGEHGLPLMGTGDWNDGMNLVGAAGKGESVWLGFFLYDVLMRFVTIAELHQDPPFAEFCRVNAERIRENLERDGWDGEWYLRAYFDSGEPLGSSVNPECMIDSVAQSWAVLSGAASGERAITAMEAINKHLILRNERLMPLLTPPFDTAPLNPGYIKGYVPGVRENGGHYSHAAIWVVMAFAALKDPQQAWDLVPLLSPIHHSRTPEEVRKYRVEPYVVASDICAAPPHTGRGGWTWYTGSAGLMYMLILESLLGVKRSGNQLTFDPCIPHLWSSYRIEYRYRSTTYHIEVKNPGTGSGVRSITVDGMDQEDTSIHLQDDEGDHQVVVELGM
jgi:cellobiose phosphorylase